MGDTETTAAESDTRKTERLAALVVLAVFVCALGLLTGSRVVLVAAIAPIVYGLYGQLTTLPALDVAVERAIEPSNPAPGAAVDVTLTVTNTGEHTVPKLQIVDGVPADLGVASGSPRRGTALRPGESVTLAYRVVAKRGVHEFGETYLDGQSFGGTTERERGIAADGVSEITCHTVVEKPVGREVTHQYTGQVATDEGGTGLEFYSTREHQHSDPVNRIDWNRYASDGELTTIEYRERRGTPIVLVVDLRATVDVARRAIDPPASELTVYAASRLLDPLLEYGNQVGLAFWTEAQIEWLPTGRGSDHERRAHLAFQAAADRDWSANTTTLAGQRRTPRRGGPSSQTAVADGTGQFRHRFERLAERLPATANVVVVTPALDAFPERAAEYFGSFGHDTTVLSPDVTSRETPGGTVAGLDRTVRLTRLRQRGTRVVSWDLDSPLAEAIARTLEGQL